MVWDYSKITTKELLQELAKRSGFYIDTHSFIPLPPPPTITEQKTLKDYINWDLFSKVITESETKPFGLVFSEQEKRALSFLIAVYILNEYDNLKLLAYALATVRIECGPKMMPVREGFAATDEQARKYVKEQNRPYSIEANGHVYYGRGYVQLTWENNYQAAGIADNPDKALDPEWAANLLFEGLLDGRWNATGNGLMFYLDRGYIVEARKTVNILDQAEYVANLYLDFYQALTMSWKEK